jgi:hypothetical protein
MDCRAGDTYSSVARTLVRELIKKSKFPVRGQYEKGPKGLTTLLHGCIKFIVENMP